MENDETHPVHPDDKILEAIEYLKVIRKTPLLTDVQEQELVKRIVQGDQIARLNLFEANRRLVVAIGKKYINRGLRFFDIIEAGNRGLIRAIDKYQLECGFKFSTYAAWWIKQTIERAVTDYEQTRTTCVPIHFPDEEAFEDILDVDHFVEHICIICGFKEDIFPVPYRFHACPRCLNKRIKELRKVEYVVPDWIVLLEKESEFKKTRQIMVHEGHIFFCECGMCKRAILQDNARYYLPPGVHISKPYCIECYERLRSGK